MSEAAPEGTPAEQSGKPDTGGPDLSAEVEKWKALARKHEAEAKSGKDAAKRLSEIEEANKTETEKAIAAARREAQESVWGEVRRERVLDRVEVLAAKEFADPEDARLRLEKNADEYLTKDGQPDADAIRSALAQLLKDKPHLAAKGDGRPKGDADQGARPTSKPEPSPGLGRLQAAYASKTP